VLDRTTPFCNKSSTNFFNNLSLAGRNGKVVIVLTPDQLVQFHIQLPSLSRVVLKTIHSTHSTLLLMDLVQGKRKIKLQSYQRPLLAAGNNCWPRNPPPTRFLSNPQISFAGVERNGSNILCPPGHHHFGVRQKSKPSIMGRGPSPSILNWKFHENVPSKKCNCTISFTSERSPLAK
jgi:hypothetical protein